MATDPSYDYPAFVPVPKCWRCHTVLNRVMKFCSDCGADLSLAAQPVDNSGPQPITRQPTMRGTIIDQGVPTWPPPAANLTPTERSARSDEVFQRPAPQGKPRIYDPHKDSTALKSIFPSGPLPEHPLDQRVQHPLWEPVLPESPARPGLAEAINALPEWLSNAVSQPTPAVTPKPAAPTTVYTTPNHLRDAPGERRSGPVDGTKADLLYVSDPTMKRLPIVGLPEPGQMPQSAAHTPPPGMVQCSGCSASGLQYHLGPPAWFEQCRTCKGARFLPDPASTGPTALALEAVKVETPAQPQTTDPIVGLVEETEGPRRHLEDLVEDMAQEMTRAGIQMENCGTRLAATGKQMDSCRAGLLRQADRLADTTKRLEWMSSEELMVLGMSEDATRKTVGLLGKAAAAVLQAVTAAQEAVKAAREADKTLSSVEMALDVGLLHATAWEETFGNKKGA